MIANVKANFVALEEARLTLILRSQAMMAGWPKNFTFILKVTIDGDGQVDVYYPPLLAGEIQNLEYGLAEDSVPMPVIRPFLNRIDKYVTPEFKTDAAEATLALMGGIW